jgi:hypothetical protein
MSTISLSELATRVEVELPTYELLEGIASGLGWKQGPGRSSKLWRDSKDFTCKLPPWLSSIDAAASLMPEGWFPSISELPGGRWEVLLERKDGARILVESLSEPQARTAAALRAREAEVSLPTRS